jgi:hypothetical protein
MNCVFCEQILICAGCGEEYRPADLMAYEALHRREVPVYCPGCGAVVVCHWCKVVYGGEEDDGD